MPHPKLGFPNFQGGQKVCPICDVCAARPCCFELESRRVSGARDERGQVPLVRYEDEAQRHDECGEHEMEVRVLRREYHQPCRQLRKASRGVPWVAAFQAEAGRHGRRGAGPSGGARRSSGTSGPCRPSPARCAASSSWTASTSRTRSECSSPEARGTCWGGMWPEARTQAPARPSWPA